MYNDDEAIKIVGHEDVIEKDAYILTYVRQNLASISVENLDPSDAKIDDIKEIDDNKETSFGEGEDQDEALLLSKSELEMEEIQRKSAKIDENSYNQQPRRSGRKKRF